MRTRLGCSRASAWFRASITVRGESMRFQLAPARVLAALGALAVVAIIVAGCGSDSDSTSSSGGGGSTSAETTGGGGEESSALFPKAAKANEEFEARPTSIGIE